jgi:predicted phosphate transport protein (TIGR00153 family)
MKATFESWFAARTRARAIEMVRQAAKMLAPSMEELISCVNSAITGNKDDLESAFTRLHQLEREGDSLRRLIITEFARGNLPVDERRSFMRLARQVDWVADWCLEAGRVARLCPMNKLPKELRATSLEMCKVVRDCVSEAQRCIDLLTDKKVDEALDAADRVERLEEEVDDLYRKGRGLLSEISGPEFTVGQVILLAQFMDAIENIADRCEDVVDQARVIAVSVGA